MLKSIKVTNFLSIKEEQELNFLITKNNHLDDSSVLLKGKDYLNKIAAIIGANGSGKSNILLAMEFIFEFINKSYGELAENALIPLKTHKNLQAENSKFVIEFLEKNYLFEDDKLYKYEIELNSKKIVKEFLGVKKIKGFSKIFSYESKDKKILSFEPEFKKELNIVDIERFQKTENIALLSFLIKIRNLEISFFNNSRFLIDKNLFFDNGFKERMLNNAISNKAVEFFEIAKKIDLSISQFKIVEEAGKKNIYCEHSSANTTFTLPLQEESDGTKRVLFLMWFLELQLKYGGIVVIDEIEAELHPLIVDFIINLFAKKETNPNNAQLIFSTHLPQVLKDRTKSQIFIVEKDREYFATEISSLDQFEKVRNDDNFMQKYLNGSYGAIPNITWQ